MKKNKLIILIIIIVLIVALVIGELLLTKNKDNNNVINNSENTVIDDMEVDENLIFEEEVIEKENKIKEADLYNKSFTEFNRIFSSDYKFEIPESGELNITIQELVNNNSFDASYLDGYNCNLEKSVFNIYLVDGVQNIGLSLSCLND